MRCGAYPDEESTGVAKSRSRAVGTDGSHPEELAAETVGTLLAEHSGDSHPPAVTHQDHQ